MAAEKGSYCGSVFVRPAYKAITDVGQQLAHQVHCRQGQVIDSTVAHQMVLLRAAETLPDGALALHQKVFATVGLNGKLMPVWEREQHVSVVLRSASLKDSELARECRKIVCTYLNKRRRIGFRRLFPGGGRELKSPSLPVPSLEM